MADGAEMRIEECLGLGNAERAQPLHEGPVCIQLGRSVESGQLRLRIKIVWMCILR